MNRSVRGIVIRETGYRESDRLIKILTSEGIITAYAKAASNIKSKKFSSTAQFCYSDFLLYQGSDMYIVTEASEKEVFFELRQDVEKLAVALYFCELLDSVVPEAADTEETLRLFLNSLHFLCKSNKEIDLIKSVFELRLMCILGFMPNISHCAECGCEEGSNMYFDCYSASVYCDSCAKIYSNRMIPLSQSALSVLRHIAFSEFSKVFNFTASKETLRNVSNITEQYVESRAERHFKTLNYFKSVRLD